MYFYTCDFAYALVSRCRKIAGCLRYHGSLLSLAFHCCPVVIFFLVQKLTSFLLRWYMIMIGPFNRPQKKNNGKGMWFECEQQFVGRSVTRHKTAVRETSHNQLIEY